MAAQKLETLISKSLVDHKFMHIHHKAANYEDDSLLVLMSRR